MQCRTCHKHYGFLRRADLFVCTEDLTCLHHNLWLCIFLGPCTNESFPWLTRKESEALPPRLCLASVTTQGAHTHQTPPSQDFAILHAFMHHSSNTLYIGFFFFFNRAVMHSVLLIFWSICYWVSKLLQQSSKYPPPNYSSGGSGSQLLSVSQMP